MRTIPFREVWNRTIRKWGRDPKAEVDSDDTMGIMEHINARTEFICEVWRWPLWELTEERAFREVWNINHQYLRVSVLDGKPDEVFYIPNVTYYRVLSTALADPPVGTLPTDTTYWEVINPVDTFISYDQRCKRAIGMVYGVYGSNPRVPTGSNCRQLRFQPSPKGIDVIQPGGPTVFVTYKMPVPVYTMIPWVNKNYSKGDVVFDPTVSECFQALTDTNSIPSVTTDWRRVPFPRDWANYVSEGAYADSLLEYDQADQADAQVRMLLSQAASGRADTYLQGKVDVLAAQGQKFKWNFCRSSNCCETLPWSGGTVSELTDVCDDELGWIYPTTFPKPQVVWQYHPEMKSLRRQDPVDLALEPTLDEMPTRVLMPGSIVQIVIFDTNNVRTLMQFQLIAGSADPTDPGQVQPLDYNAVSNNKHWEQLG